MTRIGPICARYMGNPGVVSYPFEWITVPVLVIGAGMTRRRRIRTARGAVPNPASL